MYAKALERGGGGNDSICYQSDYLRCGCLQRCSVCLRAWDVGEDLSVLLLQQEDIPVLGGQVTHFNSMVGMKSVQPRQQTLRGG